jgi:hypothetical protein
MSGGHLLTVSLPYAGDAVGELLDAFDRQATVFQYSLDAVFASQVKGANSDESCSRAVQNQRDAISPSTVPLDQQRLIHAFPHFTYRAQADLLNREDITGKPRLNQTFKLRRPVIEIVQRP